MVTDDLDDGEERHAYFEDWLRSTFDTLDSNKVRIVGARAGWRVLPKLLADLRNDPTSHRRQMQALMGCRSCLASSVSAVVHSKVAEDCAVVAGKACEKLISESYDPNFYAMNSTANIAQNRDLAAFSALSSTWAAVNAQGLGAFSIAISSVYTDVRRVRHSHAEALVQSRLWDTWSGANAVKMWGDEPNHFKRFSDRYPEWKFWLDTYERFLTGGPFDWQIYQDICLIDETVWQKGPVAVGDEINRLLTLEKLRLQADKTKSIANHIISTVEQRSHNHPPELVEETAHIKKALQDLSEVAGAIQHEANRPKPKTSTFRSLASELLRAISALAQYCSTKADLAINEAIKEASKTGTRWAVRGGAAYWALQTEPAREASTKLLQILEALIK